MQIKTLIKSGNVKLNKTQILDPSYLVRENDSFEISIIRPEEIKYTGEDIKLKIVYEDDDIIVINKSSGISMHPGAGNYDNTIVNALINHNAKQLSDIGGDLRPGIVHRIDKDTSGLVVIAKNNYAHENLAKQFSKHTITRVYQALIWGKLRPQNGIIETLIKRSSKNRQLMEVGILKGKKAITKYNTIEVFENEKSPTLSLVECKLKTGRTHQIRVHMSHKSNNIVGDQKYKKKFKRLKKVDESLNNLIVSLKRQFLHAKILGFQHPKSEKYLEFD